MNDFLLEENDLKIANGDFLIGNSNQQHQHNLLMVEKGGYKQYPTVGVGLFSYLKDDNESELLREVRIQLSKDGMTINKLAYQGGKLLIDADYGK